MHGAGVLERLLKKGQSSQERETEVVHQSRNRMIPKDSLQIPDSRALFDEPSNLICRNRDRTRMGCVFAPYFADLSTVILEEPLWRKAYGGK